MPRDEIVVVGGGGGGGCGLEPVTGVAGEGQPHVFFDLLQPAEKSPSFLVRFDLEVPRPRFVLVHRTVLNAWPHLGLADRRQLLRTALAFANRLGFHHCSLSVPIGRARPLRGDDRFFAHLLVPDQRQFRSAFERLAPAAIPLWTDPRRRTKFWPAAARPDESVAETFVRGLQLFAAAGPEEPETALTAASSDEDEEEAAEGKQEGRRKAEEVLGRRRDPRRDSTSFVWAAERSAEESFVLTLHPGGRPLVGVALVGPTSGRPEPVPPASRWEVLDALHELALDHLDLSRAGCRISVALGAPYRFPSAGGGSAPHVVGLIRFANSVPTSLAALARAQPWRRVAYAANASLAAPLRPLNRPVDNDSAPRRLRSSSNPSTSTPGSRRRAPVRHALTKDRRYHSTADLTPRGHLNERPASAASGSTPESLRGAARPPERKGREEKKKKAKGRRQSETLQLRGRQDGRTRRSSCQNQLM